MGVELEASMVIAENGCFLGAMNGIFVVLEVRVAE